jgi:hypothetical protein
MKKENGQKVEKPAAREPAKPKSSFRHLSIR